MQCWHRGCTRSTAANRPSILDKHLETLPKNLSFFFLLFSPRFLSFPIFLFNTFEKGNSHSAENFSSTILIRYDFSSSLRRLETKRKKKKLRRNDEIDLHFIDFIDSRRRNGGSCADPSSLRRDAEVLKDEEVGQLFSVPKGSVTAVLLASIPPTPTTSVLPAPSTRPLPHPQPPILFTIRVRPPGWGFWTDHRFFSEICTIFYHFPRLFITCVFLISIGNSFIEALINFKLSRMRNLSSSDLLSVFFSFCCLFVQLVLLAKYYTRVFISPL